MAPRISLIGAPTDVGAGALGWPLPKGFFLSDSMLDTRPPTS